MNKGLSVICVFKVDVGSYKHLTSGCCKIKHQGPEFRKVFNRLNCDIFWKKIIYFAGGFKDEWMNAILT